MSERARVKMDGDLKVAKHDTWLVSPRLYASIQSKLPGKPDFRLNAEPLRFWDVKLKADEFMPETRMALMWRGELVQLIEIEWV